MVYRGIVMNGAVVLDAPVTLPDGTAVEVTLADATDESDGAAPTLFEQFETFIGKAKNLPSDASTNHDHYLYGVPKKS